MMDGFWEGGTFVLKSTIYERQRKLESKIKEGEAKIKELRGLIDRAVRSAHYKHKGSPRWSGVGNIFNLGCNSSIKLCKEFGHDPDSLIPGDQLDDAVQ